MRLTEKVAIVTGGGRGIGRGISLALAREGANVVVGARTQSEIESVAEEVQALGQKSLAVAVDASRFNDVEMLVNRTLAEFGRIDILINNAGGAPAELYDIPDAIGATTLKPIWDQPEEVWDRTFEVNLKSVFLGIKAVMPIMIDQGFGDIINMSSRMGRVPGNLGAGGYSEAKHAVIALTRNAALQAAAYGVRVNAVSPSLVDTPGQRRLMATFMPEDKFPPMDSVESVAAGVMYLLCGAPKSMTGQSLDFYGAG